MRLFIALFLFGFLPISDGTPTVMKIEIFYMDFNKTTRYGYFEKDVISSSKTPVTLVGREAEVLFDDISVHLSEDSLAQYKVKNVGYGNLDLRLVCLVSYEGKSTSDTLGFSKLQYMVFNQSIYHRNPILLQIISSYIPRSHRPSTY